MSTPRRTVKVGRTFFLATALLLCGAVGCWEQWSEAWFPQMKWQKAVQAYEAVDFNGRVKPFSPPEGTVPVGGSPERLDPLDEVAQSALSNPRPASLESLENGRLQFERFCVACHGPQGMGDGPVSMTGSVQGPLAGVLPLVVANARSDGHIYSTIRYGRRRMPSYQRISSDDRWDIVNYIRYLNGQKGVGQ